MILSGSSDELDKQNSLIALSVDGSSFKLTILCSLQLNNVKY